MLHEPVLHVSQIVHRLWSAMAERRHAMQTFCDTYRIARRPKLGKGGSATVYAGFRRLDEMPVAIKDIDLAKVKYDTDGTPREVAAMQDVRHVRGAIRLLDYYITTRSLLIVMERPDSCVDLFTHISNKKPCLSLKHDTCSAKWCPPCLPALTTPILCTVTSRTKTS